MEKLHLAILRNEADDDHVLWECACRERADRIDWQVVDITRCDWLDQLKGKDFDGLLARPSAYTNAFKNLYDERIGILHQVCGFPIYPSLEEIMVYENKKYLSYWLAAQEIPHPKTMVFYYEQEALDYLNKAAFPLVGKTNIGASGRGVYILKNREEAVDYVRRTFSGKGASRSIGPNWRKKGFALRVVRKIFRPGEMKARINYYQQVRSEKQNQYVILQEFVAHSFEWRCVRIGDSFFAHKKLVVGEKASGTLLKGYENPPLSLLDFVRDITGRRNFLSQAVDIFENARGQYLVNEMQCIFGQSDPYQMLVDGQPGRYRHIDGQWIFEPGDFNRHESFLLRLDHFLSILSGQK